MLKQFQQTNTNAQSISDEDIEKLAEKECKPNHVGLNALDISGYEKEKFKKGFKAALQQQANAAGELKKFLAFVCAEYGNKISDRKGDYCFSKEGDIYTLEEIADCYLKEN